MDIISDLFSKKRDPFLHRASITVPIVTSTSTAVTAGASTVNVAAEVASIPYGGVGSYVIAYVQISVFGTGAGSTFAGSSLVYGSLPQASGLNLNSSGDTALGGASFTSLGLSGTWRLHTFSRTDINFGGSYMAGLFVRII